MADIKKLIERLKELEAKATPGPWFSLVTDMYTSIDSNQGRLADLQYPNDAALIVAMRNALPELIQILQRLEARAEKAEAERDWLLYNIDILERVDYCQDGLNCRPFEDEPEGGCKACQRKRFLECMEREVAKIMNKEGK